ncbi:MAG: hypothetical protein EPN34_00375 [Burkholderiaceae bacterium]|nr:MAG: hypothetical protein EPN34_00375 [Burkholderiaceae bacterium]
MQTYLTTEQLASRIHYEPRTIRNQLKDTVLLEGIHYVRPFGRRKILYIWEQIEEDMVHRKTVTDIVIPMASGEACHV